uniref:Secreted protein n=1 Tax=Panagrellus redivivus TaxID=6233 RepID=A0A7E4VKA2_PANRE
MMWLFFYFAVVALIVELTYDVCCDAAEDCKPDGYVYIHFNGPLFMPSSNRSVNAAIHNTVVNTFDSRCAALTSASLQLYQSDLRTACICTRKNVVVDAPPPPMTTDTISVKTATLSQHREQKAILKRTLSVRFSLMVQRLQLMPSTRQSSNSSGYIENPNWWVLPKHQRLQNLQCSFHKNELKSLVDSNTHRDACFALRLSKLVYASIPRFWQM